MVFVFKLKYIFCYFLVAYSFIKAHTNYNYLTNNNTKNIAKNIFKYRVINSRCDLNPIYNHNPKTLNSNVCYNTCSIWQNEKYNRLFNLEKNLESNQNETIKQLEEQTKEKQVKTENSIFSKLKKILDIDTYKEYSKKAESTYKNFMKLLEYEGTYFVYSYSLPPFGIYGNNIPGELKFQISFKLPLWPGAFWSKGSIFFAYTQTSWFQQFNFRYSNPVRDSNYKPSIFYAYPADWNLFGGKVKELRIGYLHFSNGIGGDECLRDSNRNPLTIEKCRSRSMGNRVIFELIWHKTTKNGDFGIHITAWPYIPKRRDNLDIDLYMGYANARLYYKYKKHFTELHIAPIISDYTQYHGSLQLGYAYKLSKFFALYGQYFYGYADSLYEYNIQAHRIGIGIRVTGF